MALSLGAAKSSIPIAMLLAVLLIPFLVYSLPTYINTDDLLSVSNLSNVSYDYFFVNVSFDNSSVDTCLINLYNTTKANYTMSLFNGSLTPYCTFNASGQDEGNWNFSVYINDTDGFWVSNGTWFVTVDTTNPSATVYHPANATYNTTNLYLNLSILEPNLDSCFYTINGSMALINGCNNMSMSHVNDNADNLLQVLVYDAAGNDNTTTILFTVDTILIPPTIYYPANTTYNSASRTLNFSYNESHLDSCWFNHNGTNTTIPSCSNYSFTAASNSATTLILYMNDSASNINSSSVVFTVDTTVPNIISRISPTVANGSNVTSGTHLINFSYYDLNPNLCILEFNNGTAVNYTMQGVTNSTGGYCFYNLGYQADGRWNYTIYVNDSAGNMNNSGFYSNWYETVGPVLTLYLPGNTTYNTTTVSLNYSGYDFFGVNTTWYQYGGVNTTLSGNTTFSATANASSTLILWANDSASNVGYTSVVLSTDTQAPTITLIYPGNQNISASSSNFTFNVSDNRDTTMLCNLTLDGQNVNGSYTISSGVPSGFVQNYTEAIHQWNLTCWDEASSATSSTKTFQYDGTYPTFTLSYPTNTTYSSGTNINLNYTAADAYLNSTYYSLSNLTNVTLSGNTTINVSHGFQYIWFHVKDAAQNVNSTQVYFTVDLDTPSILSVSPSDGGSWTSSQTVTFQYNATDLRVKNCTLVIDASDAMNDTSIETNQTNSFSKTMSNDDYTWYVRCYDYANRVGTSSSRSLTVSYSSGDSGSGSGGSGSGGGSGGGNTTSSLKESKTWDTVTSTTPAVMIMTKTENPMTKITIGAKQTMNSVSLAVEPLSAKPSSVSSAPPGSLYKYIEINATNVDATKVDSITIDFSVAKSWVQNNRIDSDTITLNRYVNNQWTRLTTNLTSQTSTEFKFSASTPGFSYFSISGDEMPIVCTAGSKSCFNESHISTCSSDNSQWVVSACQYGCDNSTSSCFTQLEGNCTNGVTRCQGNGLWTCANGSWSFDIMCEHGCSGNACALGTQSIIWYGVIIAAIACCASLIIFLFWHEKVHHTTRPGEPARNPIKRGTTSLYNPVVLNKLGDIEHKVAGSFDMPVSPSELHMEKPRGIWLRGRLRKWDKSVKPLTDKDPAKPEPTEQKKARRASKRPKKSQEAHESKTFAE